MEFINVIDRKKKALHARGELFGVHIGVNHSDVYTLILAEILLVSDSLFLSTRRPPDGKLTTTKPRAQSRTVRGMGRHRRIRRHYRASKNRQMTIQCL